jgi:hypothetical protein
MPSGAQDVHDVAGATARIPESMGQALDTKQRFDRDRRRLVQIIPALAERVPLYLAGVIKHRRPGIEKAPPIRERRRITKSDG